MERWQAVFDIHGDKSCSKAVATALRFRDRFKPQVRVIGGDLFDFGALRNGASAEEKVEGIEADVEAGIKFLYDFHPTHFLLGNHDYRIVEKAQKKGGNGVIRDHCRLLVGELERHCRELNCKLYPYDVVKGVMQYGDLRIVHGYCHGMNSAKKLGAAMGKSLMGHIHTDTEYSAEDYEGTTAYTSGMLADPEKMEYARRHMGFLRWRQSFKYGWRPNDDEVIVQTVKGHKKDWHYPTRFNK